MLKMQIDNEEVVSKNDFTIKEEMLSASSTILNNTYPKSWEDDKDYINRFYYPKDYAKLNIQNFTTIQEYEAGTTVEINGSATLTDVDSQKNSRVLSLKGQTSQTGTPTPDAPIPVNVVSGDNEISICGKNLLPQDKYITTTTKNGITYTNNGDGTFNLTGTASANTTIEIIPTNNIQLEANHSYYLYSSVPYNGTTFNMSIPMTDNGSTKFLLANNTYTPTTTPTNVRLQFYIASGQSINQTNIKLMLVKGSTAPTTYEPYIGNTYPIYLGVENLLNKELIVSGNTSNYEVTQLPTGVRLLHKNSYTTGVPTLTLTLKPNTTYTFSQKANATSGSPGSGIKTTNGSYSYVTTGSQTITTESDGVIIILFGSSLGSGVSCDYTDIQLEEGTKQNSFTPYGTTPIELCKIGTYQDYIYKDNGSWYLHKEIGKVVLNGSESWSYQSNYPRFFMNLTTASSSTSRSQTYSNYFKYLPSGNDNYGAFVYESKLFIYKYDTTSTSDFSTWLSTHNTIVYYVLETPTTTQITDTTLISQLDALESS